MNEVVQELAERLRMRIVPERPDTLVETSSEGDATLEIQLIPTTSDNEVTLRVSVYRREQDPIHEVLFREDRSRIALTIRTLLRRHQAEAELLEAKAALLACSEKAARLFEGAGYVVSYDHRNAVEAHKETATLRISVVGHYRTSDSAYATLHLTLKALNLPYSEETVLHFDEQAFTASLDGVMRQTLYRAARYFEQRAKTSEQAAILVRRVLKDEEW
jgi:hypothetical protein